MNLALLAKQGWHILKNLDYLVATILKEKYFSNRNFLNANLGTRPSYAWWSLFKSLELLKEGLCWRMGNGQSIKIWEDKWIPNPVSCAIQLPVHVLPPNALVSSLIDAETNWWNFLLLHNIFSLAEASQIASMVVSPQGNPDKLVWIDHSNGLFSAKSAYHMAKEKVMRSGGECSTVSSTKLVWKKVWQMNVPGMVRTFLWRFCTNSLPTKANLFSRKIAPDPLCPLCGSCPESIVHILWGCKSTTAMWMECSRKIQKLSFVASDGISLFTQLMGSLEDDELAKAICIARLIWLRRNTVLFEGVLSSPIKLV